MRPQIAEVLTLDGVEWGRVHPSSLSAALQHPSWDPSHTGWTMLRDGRIVYWEPALMASYDSETSHTSTLTDEFV